MIDIYSDGSSDTQKRVGGWAAIVLMANEKIVLSGKCIDTTHNRMELTAVIKAMENVRSNRNYNEQMLVRVISDSQYVINLTARQNKLTANNFLTKKGTGIQNTDLVKTFLNLTNQMKIEFIKIKAHQKRTDVPNLNIEVDKLSRKITREMAASLNKTDPDL